MKIILIITILESLVVALWALARKQSRNGRLEAAAIRLYRPLKQGDSTIFRSLAPNASDITRWAFINDWHVGAQADDRTPVSGSATDGPGSPSARRSVARRSHQLRYKEWSKGRSE